MVADIRFKVRMRIREALKAVRADARPGGQLQAAFLLARTNPEVATRLKEYYRTRVASEVPGCRVEFTRKNIYVYFPAGYGAGRAPVSEPMPIDLVVVFHPTTEASF